MTDFLFKAFDLFIAAAKKLATYLPQSGSDLIQIFQQFVKIANGINSWVVDNLGIDFQRILAVLGRFVVLGFNIFIDFVSKLVERI